jgi:Protein of unknown function (DUF1360)
MTSAGKLAKRLTAAARREAAAYTAGENRPLGSFVVIMGSWPRNPVTSPLRAPFTRYSGTSGEAELAEEVRGRGRARHWANWSAVHSA